ncbi:exonuclease 1-like [Halichondria panicea]|uniref:exonuclease 1-like n=1 Tax=Halichondria panicea TaxID=6063 RepID=UPI00312B955C
MGITGLLPFLKSIQREVHLSSFRGKKAAIDSYCWLHKGSYSCALQLVMGTTKLETLPFIKYCMKKVNLLRQHDITPVMVFDGGRLPTKAHTEHERRQRRREYREKGKQLLKDGRRSEAVDCFQKCVDVSPDMALALIKECRKIGVECVVAPYEADSQLTYLQNEGIVDFVITEDSDLLVFGCERVLFKLDDAGNGKLIELKELGKANKGLVGFTQDSFRQMCIFSGCDYLSSVPGIGLGKSLKLMRRCHQNPTQVIRTLQCETGKVPPSYEEDFQKAESTFLYQLVFDPRSQSQVRLHPLPQDMSSQDIEFAGVENSPKKAVNMARGNIDPISLCVLDTYSPSKVPPPPKTMAWSESVMSSSTKYPVAIQAKLPLVASERSKQPFRAPKRKLEEEILEEESTEENVFSLYSQPSPESSHVTETREESTDATVSSQGVKESNQPINSRYFSTEATPSDDNDCPSRRALTNKQLTQQSPGSVRKVLFDKEIPRDSILKMRSMYQYSTKKPRTDNPFEVLDQCSQPSTQQRKVEVSRNPFSKSNSATKQPASFTLTSQQPLTTDHEPPFTTDHEPLFTTDHDEPPVTTDHDEPPVTTDHATIASPTVEPALERKVMTSASFLTPHSSHTAQQSSGSWLGKKKTGPNKRGTRIGLSKSTTSSNFKAPRPSEGQTNLGMFGYTRKPQLKR